MVTLNPYGTLDLDGRVVEFASELDATFHRWVLDNQTSDPGVLPLAGIDAVRT